MNVRRIVPLVLLVVFTVPVALEGCGDDNGGGSPLAPPQSTATKKVVTMTGNTTFSPANVTINKGDTVVWFNVSGLIHTTTSGSGCTASGLWNSGSMGQNAAFMVVFDSTGVDTTGTIPYYCIPHCQCCAMVGTITINP